MMTPCSLISGYRGSRRSMLSPSSGHVCSTFCKLHIVITHRSQYDYEDLDSVKGREFLDQSREYKRRIVVPRVSFTSRKGTEKIKPEASCGRSGSVFLSWTVFARVTDIVLKNFQTSKTGIVFGIDAIVEPGRLRPLHTHDCPSVRRILCILEMGFILTHFAIKVPTEQQSQRGPDLLRWQRSCYLWTPCPRMQWQLTRFMASLIMYCFINTQWRTRVLLQLSTCSEKWNRCPGMRGHYVRWYLRSFNNTVSSLYIMWCGMKFINSFTCGF